VLYQASQFGGKPPTEAQRRFVLTTEEFLALVERLSQRHRRDKQVRIGIAPHSLRAVTPELLSDAITGLDALDPQAPIHIHIAEQTKEVEDCVAWSGQRPVEWLLDHMPVGPRWCLVHATHMTEAEMRRLAESEAVAGLCPTTEANLGDGVFPARDYLRQGGRFGIGSDSHVSISPGEELRWLEYGQRLVHRRRNLLAEGGGSVGAALYRKALAGGAQALGREIGRLAPGARADLVVLDAENPILLGRTGDQLIDAFIFAGNVNPVRDVMVGGRWVVEEGRHAAEDAVRARFRDIVTELTA
jgi:formimidoylglutamate deiminase